MAIFRSPSKTAKRGDMKFTEVVRRRRATRKFIDRPLAVRQIQEVLEDAQWAPSNCNTQPWQIHIVSGASRDRLSKALMAAEFSGNISPDFFFNEEGFQGKMYERAFQTGQKIYGAQGIKRGDAQKRREFVLGNFEFYGAPHVALIFMPHVGGEKGDDVRTAADCGMYLQTFLLALTARGISSLPQAMLSLYANTVRQTLGISNEYKLLCSVCFGYADHFSPNNQVMVGRAPIQESTTFHS